MKHSFEKLENDINDIDDDNPYKSLLAKQAKILKQELSKRMESESPTVKLHLFTGLEAGKIKVSQLNMLQSFQKMLNCASNKILGNGKDNGRIPNNILEKNELLINSVKAGSFIIYLKASPSITQLSINNSKNETWDQILCSLLELINNESENNVTKIAEKYGYRTYNASKEWIRELKNSNLNLIYSDTKNRKLEFDSHRIAIIDNDFSNTTLKSNISEVELSGKIVSISKDEALYIETSEGLEEKIQVKDNSLRNSTISFKGKNYTFNVLKESLFNSKTGMTITKYSLDTFNP
ncbi:hypothetical protein N7X57_05415 [Lactiplantibacillus paraplantarum]|uniref:hypothetical protein n=1 Tax=Lactiplantibacillus paraplantarum TaxID=60520 RepID=UPI002222FD8A|nr:hypothetical protein [Lactiplantibacillus paraplantarum]MCW1909883.1 hypothetical protein [Lactiplantibacillus paraplantarum]